MPNPSTPRLLEPDDPLYRKVQPEQWDEEGVHPTAFRDKHSGLSLFVARIKSPASVLAMFARYPAVMRACGTGRRVPTPAEMYAAGYRIAVLPSRVIAASNFRIEVDENGHQFREDGHVNVIDGQKLAISRARNARLLRRDETLR